MKIVHISEIKLGMILAQNTYRNDSLLAFPKGVKIGGFELKALKEMGLEFVLVHESFYKGIQKDDLNYTLDIIESAYVQNVIWEEEFGRELFEKLENKIITNKKIIGYLNEMRVLDSYSFSHSINISILVAMMMKEEEDIVDEDLVEITFLSLVHDVGRINMKEIFNKEGKLNHSEYLMLKQHPLISFKLLKKAGIKDYNLKFTQETHEKYDGTGYPYNLEKNEISNLAQIIFLAELYNALSSHRPHRDPFLPYEVVNMLKEEINKGFPQKYYDIFMEKFTPYSVGDQVELTDGNVGIIKMIKSNSKINPIVDIIDDNGNLIKTVDLTFQKEIKIKKVIKGY